MQLIIVRHGDPDYKNDSLTEKGWREAQCLAEYFADRFRGQGSADTQGSGRLFFYMSPYGRAQDTASLTLKKLGRTAEVLPWLKEFDVGIVRPHTGRFTHVPWDWLPQDWTSDPRMFTEEQWSENEYLTPYNVGEEYRKVTDQFDAFLATHGYRRDGRIYRVDRSNHDTLVLFCHLGVESVMLSHMFGVSPMILWHLLGARASSFTTLASEERRKGIATFRLLAYGETTHLYMKGEEPSFACRFCECFEDDARHD